MITVINNIWLSSFLFFLFCYRFMVNRFSMQLEYKKLLSHR